MKFKFVVLVVVLLGLLGGYGMAKASHSSCHGYQQNIFDLCFYDWLAEYNGWRGRSLDSYLTQRRSLTMPSGQVGSYLVDFESIFNKYVTMFDSSYVLGGDRCARSRFSAQEGSILYACNNGVYVRGEFRALVNFKAGQYKFHLFNNDGAALFVWPFGWIINNINYRGLGTQFDSSVYALPGGYTYVAVFYNFSTPTYNANPWPGEPPRLKLWWDNINEKSLSVSVNGGGKIVGPGIDCGSDCTESYNVNTQVILSVIPTTGYDFAGWSGDCSGVGACALIMDSGKSVIANFVQKFSLNVSGSGIGSGDIIGPGIDCGIDCSESYDVGTVLSLSANPSQGSLFVGWSGNCSGFGNCSLIMDGDKSVTAIFKKSDFKPSSEPGGIREVRP